MTIERKTLEKKAVKQKSIFILEDFVDIFSTVDKKSVSDIEIVTWGESCKFDMVINATSLGLKKQDKINLNYDETGVKKFFYDIIYNPIETDFLKQAKKNFHRIENGKMMFIYQAHLSFTLWHKVMPEINDEVIDLISK